VTSTRPSREDVLALVAAGLDASDASDSPSGRAEPVDARELGGGTYNTVYRVAVAGGDDVVVKIAPPPDAPALAYERHLLRTEAMFDELAAERTSVPVPRLVHSDFTGTHLDGDAIVLSVLPGRPCADRRRPSHALGRTVAELHTVRGDRYGYPHGGPDLQTNSWRAAFPAMVDAVLADADRFEVELGAPPSAVRRVVRDNAGWLDDVTEPTLVHFDLWDGNLLVDEHGRLTGIVDAERAFWGDPHADFASLALFATIEADGDFLAGYAEGGGRVEPGPSFTRRQALYRTYLYLVMAVEAAPRGYGAGWQRAVGVQVSEHLRAELRRLEP
jgi:aminoglycoside phosphotransferase (APT) family kinase protein